MRAVLGFVLVNVWLVVIGLTLLRALRLTGGDGWREVVMIGPGLVFGVVAITPLLVLCLVVGIPVTVLTVIGVGAAVVVASGAVVGVRRRAAPARAGAPGGASAGAPAGPPAGASGGASAGAPAGLPAGAPTGPPAGPPASTRGPLGWVLAASSVAYALAGGLAFASAPSRGDDARIWSLRGLTLIDFHRLQPEIFLNQSQAGGHPVYPLLQPLVETIVAEAMGSPQLRIYHSEIWMLAISVLWTVALLLARRAGAPDWRRPYWLAPLGLIALTPFLILNVYVGDADITGSVMFGAAIVAFGLWLQSGERRYVAGAALLLAAAASTKDEELLSTLPVLVVLLVCQIRRRSAAGGRPRIGVGRRRIGLGRRSFGAGRRPFGAGGRRIGAGGWRIAGWREWLAAVAGFACLILPWRLWLSAHHLTDSVEPKLPQALSPVWLIDRGTISQVAPAMLNQILVQWSWLAAIFLVTCGVCLVTRTAVRVTIFYLAAIFGVVLVLFWLYVATPLPLSFLIPTSMDRIVGVFMVAAGMASAHLLSTLLSSARASSEGPVEQPAEQPAEVAAAS